MRLLIVVIAALLTSGCLAFDRITLHNLAKARGDWPAAVQHLREEVASPRPTYSPNAHGAAVRQIFLVTLGELAALQGLRPEMDAEALRVYEEGLARYGGNDPERMATLHNGIVIYYSKTRRNGTALPYIRKELELRKRLNDPLRLLLSYDALGSAYTDMGELQLAAHYRAETQRLAAQYWVIGSSREHWEAYATMFSRWLDAAYQSGNRPEFERLWRLYESMTDRHLSAKSLPRFTAAEYYALFGDVPRAMELLGEATTMLEAEGKGFPGAQRLLAVVRVCKTASVLSYAGRAADAVKAFEECRKVEAASGGASSKEEVGVPIGRGLAYEGLGEFPQAMAAYQEGIVVGERMRGAFTLAERAAFFRGVASKPYTGFIRAAARRASVSGAAADLLEALRATELVRARQLGELLGAGEELTVERLRAFRAALAPDEAVLAYSMMERHWVLLAFTAERHVAHVADHEGHGFRREILGVATALGQPDSPLPDLSSRLTALGTTFLGPARELLAGKTRVLVLPDGVLSAVPFDALGVAGESYRPLVADVTVRVAPSLRLLLARPSGARAAGGGLLAMADPVYSKSPAPGGLAKDELAAVTRGSRYLDYFTPLPETRTEVQAIAGLFTGESTEFFLGERARESALKQADLLRFRHLHLATHGILGGEVPGVGEPALVLGEEPGEDGFLTASEVERLKLDADLTVLSACNTGSGEYFTGEGVMGLSRSFLLAGSRAVVVSLWPVASKATERFMVDLYRHLRDGRPAPEALRRAKLEMIERARRSGGPEAHPFFWAPFILFGG